MMNQGVRILLIVFFFAVGCAKSGSKSNEPSAKPPETSAKPADRDNKDEMKEGRPLPKK